MNILEHNQKKILLGVTGGISAYKVAELCRLLIKNQYQVQVIMTKSAQHFITPATFQALTNQPVFTDLWDERIGNGMAHIDLSRQSDAILIAPASANFIAKLAQGMADDLLSTLCLARTCPLIVAPAMNRQMWENPATQRNIHLLKQDGVSFFGPACGVQACGEVGMGRLLEPEELVIRTNGFFQEKSLKNKRILITAGPTFEPIDAVRGITNTSSGKMGYAIAQAACDAGAHVILVSGPTALPKPVGLKLYIGVHTAQEMFEAVQSNVLDTEVFISVAAVADYHVKNPKTHKIKKTADHLVIELEKNPDILSYVSHLEKPPYCVGFAAESQNLLQFAEEKRRRKKLPLLAANLVQTAMNQSENELILLDDHGQTVLPRSAKSIQARQLIEAIAQRLDR